MPHVLSQMSEVRMPRDTIFRGPSRGEDASRGRVIRALLAAAQALLAVVASWVSSPLR